MVPSIFMVGAVKPVVGIKEEVVLEMPSEHRQCQ